MKEFETKADVSEAAQDGTLEKEEVLERENQVQARKRRENVFFNPSTTPDIIENIRSSSRLFCSQSAKQGASTQKNRNFIRILCGR